MKTKRKPRTFLAAGVLLAAVPLASGNGEAVMHAADLDRLSDAGVGCNLCLNPSGRGIAYVRASQRGGNTVNVARFIAGARRGEVVRYHDGDRRNLRRENLYLTRGKARMDCRSCEKIREAV
jgi:hypothetical protein